MAVRSIPSSFIMRPYILLIYLGNVIAGEISSAKRGTITALPDFEELLRCTTFVDKTLFIEEFFGTAQSSPFQLILCPRKFGKTTNLNMIKRFVEISVDEDGEIIRKKQEEIAYFIFADPAVNLKIASSLRSYSTLYRKHFKSYAVISLSFQNVVGNTYESIIDGLRESIRTTFESYEWLYQILLRNHRSENETRPILETQLSLMKRILERKSTEDDLINGLFELSKILHQYFGISRMCFLLLDDYDAPIQNAITYNLDIPTIAGLIEKILAKLLNPNNCYIRYALITGTTNILKTNFAHIKHRPFTGNHHIAKYFGFSDDEVDKLLEVHGADSYEKHVVMNHFGAYVVAHTGRYVYNPFSIVTYLAHKQPTTADIHLENFWAETGPSSELIRIFRNPKLANIIAEILVGRKFEILCRRFWSIQDLQELRQLLHHPNYHIGSYQVRLFASYLFEHGYLTNTNKPYVYAIPNKEIETHIIDEFQSYFHDHCGLNLDPLRESLLHIIEKENTTEGAVTNCEKILRTIFYKHPLPFEHEENLYQAAIYTTIKEYIPPNINIMVVNLRDQIPRRLYLVVEKEGDAIVTELNYQKQQIDDNIPYEVKVNAVYQRYRELKTEFKILGIETS